MSSPRISDRTVKINLEAATTLNYGHGKNVNKGSKLLPALLSDVCGGFVRGCSCATVSVGVWSGVAAAGGNQDSSQSS